MKYVSVSCQSNGTAAVMTPDTPPIVNRKMKLAKKRNAVVSTGRPVQIVAIQANTETALGTAMIIEAALKNASERLGRPVANIGCSHTPKPKIIVVTVASATAL